MSLFSVLRCRRLLFFFGVLFTVVYLTTVLNFLTWYHQRDGVGLKSRKTTAGRLQQQQQQQSRYKQLPHCYNTTLTSLDRHAAAVDDAAQEHVRSTFIDDVINVESPTLFGCPANRTAAAFRQVAAGSFIYSAYLDNRSSTPAHESGESRDGNEVIRFVALLAENESRRPRLYCHVWLDGVHRSSPMDYYEMCENHGKKYGGWILSCHLPFLRDYPIEDTVAKNKNAAADGIGKRTGANYGSLPCEVGVSTDASDSDDIVTFPVYRTRRNPVRTSDRKPIKSAAGSRSRRRETRPLFGVCVSPLFGHIPAKTLIEFVELTRLLGADHIVFYWSVQLDEDDGGDGGSMSSERQLWSVVQYYRRMGVVSVVNWTLPVAQLVPTMKSATMLDLYIWNHGQLLAINDCMYRTMDLFRFVAFNDIDEYIVPVSPHSNWSTMLADAAADTTTTMNEISLTSQPPFAYSFRSAFFDPMSSSMDSFFGKDLVDYSLESDVRTFNFSVVRTKLIVDPSRMFELGIHHVSRTLERTVNKTLAIRHVDPSIAFVHHYRRCSQDYDPRVGCERQCVDDSLIRSWRYASLRRRCVDAFNRLPLLQ